MLIVVLFGAGNVSAQQLNDKLVNRPYADMRRFHLGFSVGVHAQDITFVHNGLINDNGEQWFMEQPSFSPGFCVNGLMDLRLGPLLNLRFTPGMYFGNRDVTMLDVTTGSTERQNLKSALVVLPVDLKFSGWRMRNARPYVTAGIMPTFNVTHHNGDFLRTKPTDFYITTGLGCDFYLPYFKFIPEVKFCFGLTDVIDHKRPDLEDEPEMMKITRSLKRAVSRMVVLTFYFE